MSIRHSTEAKSQDGKARIMKREGGVGNISIPLLWAQLRVETRGLGSHQIGCKRNIDRRNLLVLIFCSILATIHSTMFVIRSRGWFRPTTTL